MELRTRRVVARTKKFKGLALLVVVSSNMR